MSLFNKNVNIVSAREQSIWTTYKKLKNDETLYAEYSKDGLLIYNKITNLVTLYKIKQ